MTATKRAPKAPAPIVWRTKRQPDTWYTGPQEGWEIYYFKRGGVSYEVQARYRDMWNRSGAVVWSASGRGYFGTWKSLEAAKRACERAHLARINEQRGNDGAE